MASAAGRSSGIAAAILRTAFSICLRFSVARFFFSAWPLVFANGFLSMATPGYPTWPAGPRQGLPSASASRSMASLPIANWPASGVMDQSVQVFPPVTAMRSAI